MWSHFSNPAFSSTSWGDPSCGDRQVCTPVCSPPRAVPAPAFPGTGGPLVGLESLLIPSGARDRGCTTQDALETGSTDYLDMVSPSTATDWDEWSANALHQTQIFPFPGTSKRDHGTSARFPLCSFASSSAEHRWSPCPALPPQVHHHHLTTSEPELQFHHCSQTILHQAQLWCSTDLPQRGCPSPAALPLLPAGLFPGCPGLRHSPRWARRSRRKMRGRMRPKWSRSCSAGPASPPGAQCPALSPRSSRDRF